MTAKLVFGALLFLVVTSFLVLPCLNGDGGMFRSVQAQSCTQQKIFKPQADLCKLFDTLPAAETVRFLTVFLIILGAVVFAHSSDVSILRIKRRWRRFASLPFATSNPPRLPYFAAQRDA